MEASKCLVLLFRNYFSFFSHILIHEVPVAINIVLPKGIYLLFINLMFNKIENRILHKKQQTTVVNQVFCFPTTNTVKKMENHEGFLKEGGAQLLVIRSSQKFHVDISTGFKPLELQPQWVHKHRGGHFRVRLITWKCTF